MFTRIIKLQNQLWWLGFVLLVFSFLMHVILSVVHSQAENRTGDYFIMNFCITAVYALALFFGRKNIHPAEKQAHRILLYALLLVSAWALNHSMSIFQSPVLWMSVVQVAVVMALITLCFFRYLPPVVNHIGIGILGIGFLLFLYMSVYLFPLYIFGIILAPALGISLHSFAPLFITITTIVLVAKMCSYRNAYRYSFFAGLSLALIATVLFCIQWASAVKELNKAYRQSRINDNPDIPAWVQTAQQVSPDAITEKALKLGLVYTEPGGNWDEWGFSMPSLNYNEPKKHDPLIGLASLFRKPAIGSDEKIRILESTYNNRYATEERLWAGDNLTTENISTQIRIWPEWQIAYTEKTIAVLNSGTNRFRGQEEAIYLFTLPEGSVVSSLSLWVNGVEEKGILTTKEKATTAYNSIVGVEKRDPSVIHWQEGNQVSVRVFPVMPDDQRLFKIGVTTPLRKYENEIVYENIFFTGPSGNKATETIKLEISGKPEIINKPSFLRSTDQLVFAFDGKYKPDWQFSFKAQDINQHGFVYKGKAYTIARYNQQLMPYAIEQVYVDINSEWEKKELDDILQLFRYKDILVHRNGWVKITEQNAEELFKLLSKQSFSLFPFYAIKDAAKALVITKGNTAAPNLKDLKDTPFDTKTRKYFKTDKQLRVLDLGKSVSPYLKTLIEQRALNYEKADWSLLKKIAADHAFPVNQETEDQVVLKDAGITIKRSDSSEAGNAPDHLYRLFAYNNIMRQFGKYRNDTLQDPVSLVAEAEQAYIVTPVSSLIVLESQADYERFNIKDSKDNLQNASHNKSGAVPEPHEWALIITGLVSLWYLRKNRRLKKAI